MKYFILMISTFFINADITKQNKIKGEYYYNIEKEYYNIPNGKIIFNDSIFVFDNKFKTGGRISYGNSVLLDNFINTDLIVSIPKNQIGKDTMIFYIHNKKSPAMNYLDFISGKGNFIRIK